MNKEEVLQAVREAAARNQLSQAELLAAYNSGQGTQTVAPHLKQAGLADVLSYLGGAIVAIGIAILIATNWDVLSTPVQLLATLGVGLAAYVSAWLLGQREETANMSQAGFLASAIILPIGLSVAFDKAGYDLSLAATQTALSAVLLFIFALTDYLKRQAFFTLLTIIFGTWFYFASTSYITAGAPHLLTFHFQEYRVLLAGLTYILLGYAFSATKRQALTGILYSFGLLGFLGAALALSGWIPEQNVFWEVIFPGLVFGVIFLSIHLKSKAFLTFGALFLIAYIMKLTWEYFSDSLGWPLALVIAGLVLVGVGYLTHYLNKKYLRTSAAPTPLPL